MKILNSAQEVIANVSNHSTIFVQGACGTPVELLKALYELRGKLNGVELVHLHTHADPLYSRPFKITNLFVGANMRKEIDYDRVDYLPCFLSEIPQLFKSGAKKINVALIQISPPDQHGLCSLGTSVDVTKAAVECAQLVLAQINPLVPRVHGDGFLHVSKIDYAFEYSHEIWLEGHDTYTEVEKKIGQQVAGIIDEGSTLQLGIGAVPAAVCEALMGHRNLGLHSEMWSTSAMKLIKAGVITNQYKKLHAGKSVASFLMGDRELFEFVDDNPQVILLGADYVNNPHNIARNPKVIAINSAVEIDLTGQICADSIGPKIISGVGGQMDFMRGAALSEGGKPIIALTSRTKKGTSRIVGALRLGAGVVTTRSHVHYVATEYGVANLYGKSLHQRAQALIAIAHPDDRELLAKQWRDLYHS